VGEEDQVILQLDWKVFQDQELTAAAVVVHNQPLIIGQGVADFREEEAVV